MEFKGKTLDVFQKEAIESIDKNHSCVVSASTGTGKTLIAEYIINKHLPEGNTIIYTAPIKALSNQKYKDFCEDYGKENVGLLTGDTSINHEGQILIMTTEIYRNMLLTNDPLIDRVSYVIFDEIHYINDIERGTVWEESIIFSPKHIRFLALSATIPNYREFADWIAHIKEHPVDTVFYGHRPVPLRHKVYDRRLGLCEIKDVQIDMLKEEEYSRAMEFSPRYNPGKKKKAQNKAKIHNMKPPYHLDVIKELEGKMPALYFCFSRKKTQDFAVELSKKQDFLNKEEAQKVLEVIRNHMTPEVAKMETTKVIRNTLPKGIGFHHSGMLPVLKTIVEELFGQGLIKILYTTETFSVGINMPAKAVVFNSLEKYDGINMRMLNAKEYFQIAGRAGRRGIDKEGLVIALINRRFTNLEKLHKISTVDDEPIISHFTLSINTALNLIDNFDENNQERVLKSNFDHYKRLKENKKAVHIMASFKNKIKLLKKLNYIKETDEVAVNEGAYVESNTKYMLTDKGRFAKYLYSNEIILTELFHLDFLNKISDIDLLILLASIVYEQRRLDYFMIKGTEKRYHRILKIIEGTVVGKELNKVSLKRMINFVTAWADGSSFTELMTYSNLAEGDIIRFFRRLIDTLTQLLHATEDKILKERLEGLIKLIDRDLVSSE
ncbi:DEAD/DEAH box helicase [Candidatus Woesearchaeota archaeon]|nr:DEAD/DEAH box helicase [Candidatus Woesearchaeota archaeon]